jgi:predicted Zn-dependent protease
MVRPLLLALVLISTRPAFADVPITERVQHMRFPRDPVHETAAHAYHQELSRLKARGLLDSNRRLLDRIQRSTARLIAQAIVLKPEAAGWQWEVRLSADPQVGAYSRAGGKLMVGSHFVETYGLSDDELAVALAHEIGHAIAEHVREQVSMAATFDPSPPNHTITVAETLNAMESDISVFLRLQPLSRLQEMEADDIGVELAARSGIAPAAIKSFYAKITRAAAGQSVLDNHGPARERRLFAMSMADYAKATYEANPHISVAAYVFR